jgi:hypothetical protein
VKVPPFGAIAMNEKLHPQIKIGASTIFVNPGTGGVDGASEANARANMRQFVKDCDSSLHWHWRRDKNKDYGDGRYAFKVYCDEFPTKKIEIQMPGWGIERVRYMGTEGQNVWHFPRLYVDGSSWLWEYAILDRENFEDD